MTGPEGGAWPNPARGGRKPGRAHSAAHTWGSSSQALCSQVEKSGALQTSSWVLIPGLLPH